MGGGRPKEAVGSLSGDESRATTGPCSSLSGWASERKFEVSCGVWWNVALREIRACRGLRRGLRAW